MTRLLKYGFAVGGGVLLLEAVLVLPAGVWAEQLVAWIHGAGVAGVAAYVAAYVTVTLLLLPASLLTGGAGLAYGPILGTTLVSPVSVAAVTLAFLLGRTVARDWVATRIAGDARFAAIDAAIGRPARASDRCLAATIAPRAFQRPQLRARTDARSAA